MCVASALQRVGLDLPQVYLTKSIQIDVTISLLMPKVDSLTRSRLARLRVKKMDTITLLWAEETEMPGTIVGFFRIENLGTFAALLLVGSQNGGLPGAVVGRAGRSEAADQHCCLEEVAELHCGGGKVCVEFALSR